jgi:hypothetical protein
MLYCADALFTDSIVTYESGDLPHNDGTDSPGAWTNEYDLPIPKETTNDENVNFSRER